MLYEWRCWWRVYHAWVADTLVRSFWSSYPLYVITISMYAATRLFLRHHFGVYIYTTLHEHVQAKSMYWKYLSVLTLLIWEKWKKIFTSCDTAFFCIWNFFIYIILVREKQLNIFSCISWVERSAIFSIFFSLKGLWNLSCLLFNLLTLVFT